MAEELFDVEEAPAPDPKVAEPADKAVNIVIRVHVQPSAGRSAIVGHHANALHVRVAPPPADGRANRACVELLAELFDRPASSVELVSGERSREKRFRVKGVTLSDARHNLAEALDKAGSRPGPARRGGRNSR